MSRFKTPEAEESVGCNLIPMIDIMFLLLLFFMLGADMSQREFEDVVLPPASEVKEDSKEKGSDGLTTINLHHRDKTADFSCAAYDGKPQGHCREESHWLMAISGHNFTWETINLHLSELSRLEPETPGGKSKLSKRVVMIRADQMAPYGSVQKVIEACGNAGLYKVEVGAAMPPK